MTSGWRTTPDEWRLHCMRHAFALRALFGSLFCIFSLLAFWFETIDLTP